MLIRVFRKGAQEQRLAVADLVNGGVATFKAMLKGVDVGVVYGDPPWNPGNEKFWRRHAKVTETNGYDKLLMAWVECAMATGASNVFVEQSINPLHKDMMAKRLVLLHLPLICEWRVLYGSPKRPNALMHYGRRHITIDPTGMSGEAMTYAVLNDVASNEPVRWVADPCMGLGTTSRVAHRLGWSCVGTELNPARLERTIEKLLKLGYVEVT
jgi:hypothetical protein